MSTGSNRDTSRGACTQATGSIPLMARAGPPQADDARDLTLSVVVPTRHEAENAALLVERLQRALAGVRAEIVFVDDSDDETPSVIDALVRGGVAGDCEIGLLHRPASEREGALGGAVVRGLRVARGEWVCVLDGDLQHPPELVPVLLDKARATGATLVAATRYQQGGDAAGLTAPRSVASRVAAGMARSLFSRAMRSVSDPMSGFFLVRRDRVDVDSLRPFGFKILLEIIMRTPGLRIAEVPYAFATRHAGESKASAREGLRYVRHLARLRLDGSASRPHVHRRGPHCYDVHGIVTVESDGPLPELEAFRVDALGSPPTIRVRISRRRAGSVTTDGSYPRMHYAEATGFAGFAADIELGDCIEVVASPLLRWSPHVLYTNLVEPILRWTFVRRGYALAHGACVVLDRDAFMVTARTDTGKTTTMLKLLDAYPYRFVSDDFTIVCPDGRVLPYPKPLTISAHTLHAVKTPRLSRRERATLGLQSRIHSRSGRRFAFLLTRTGLPVSTINAVVQILIPPPKYPVQRLVPGVEVAHDAKLAGLFVIERAQHRLEWLDEDDALEILLDNCEDAYGFPPYHAIEDFLLGAASEDLRAIERQTLAGALERVPAVLLGSTRLDWASRIHSLISELRPADHRVESPVPVVDGGLVSPGSRTGFDGHGHADGDGQLGHTVEPADLDGTAGRTDETQRIAP